MAAFLVTGNPGAGKTTTASALTERGFDAIDTDEIAGWETATGRAATQPEDPTGGWLLDHRWVWNARLLDEAIQARDAAGPPRAAMTGPLQP